MSKIPKIIHYCWFGGTAKSEKILRCMQSWREYLPDYKIIEWNETNCDITASKFANTVYNEKIWALVADYFRFKALYEYGGIYLDTDMLVHKSFDDLLKYNAVFPMETYETVCAGIIGAVPAADVIGRLIDVYDRFEPAEEGKPNTYYAVTVIITQLLLNMYGYKQTGHTQILGDNIAVFAPNVLIINTDDGLNYCEHLYDAKPIWWDEQKLLEAGGKTWKHTVLMKYYHNLFGRPDCDFDKIDALISSSVADIADKQDKVINNKNKQIAALEQNVVDFLQETAPLLEQSGKLDFETANELYGMYEIMALTVTEHIADINPELRVKLCSGMDEILDRVVDFPLQFSAEDKNNIYAPALEKSRWWNNTDLMKDCGLVPYMLAKETGLHPIMLYGEITDDFKYLDLLPGMEVLRTEEKPGTMEIYREYLKKHYRQMDALTLYGIYTSATEFLNEYRQLRPDGKVYCGLDMNSIWMNEIIDWTHSIVRRYTAQCDIVATSCCNMRDALNRNPKVNFPCRLMTNGFYNPTGIPVIADAGKKENIILTVGRIGTKQKNTGELMNVYAQIAEQIPNWTLRLVGGIDPEFEPVIGEFFDKYPNLKDKVIFTGAITDKAELYKEYAKAKVFALTSTFEGGTPNSYAEALFHGCMFVTSDIDGADDITNYGQLGEKYKLGDTQALKTAFIKVCKSATEAGLKEHIPKALSYANRYFDWNRNAKKLAYMLFRG